MITLFVGIALGSLGFPQQSAPARDQEYALATEREVERIAAERSAGERALWPGFEPLTIPLAIATGERTFLFRHPAPPEGFERIAGATPRVFGYLGRHPAVVANTSATIGTTMTATVMADAETARLTPTELAATALHEAFHVYQRRRHPTWIANEADAFLYPTDNGELLGLRRLESEALRRAVAAADDKNTDPKNIAGWARRALEYRRKRFAAMEAAFAAYERGNELNEGLATYVQLAALGTTTMDFPVAEFPATAIRDRIYVTGPALARILDRLSSGWQASLEADDKQTLDGILEEAVATRLAGKAPAVDLAPGEIAKIRSIALADAAAVVKSRAERRKAFDAQSGWRVVVRAAEGKPLWVKGFDPLNVAVVDGGLLHVRMLQLGNDAGELQAIREARAPRLEMLTEAVAAHPLFNGVRSVTIVGFSEKPQIESKDRHVAVTAPGFTAKFKNATLTEKPNEVIVQLETAK